MKTEAPSLSTITRHTLRVALLLSVPALIAWLTGRPFIFPSLGPSAFSLVIDRHGETSGRTVLGGHMIGVIGGLLAYHAIAHGLSLIALPSQLSYPLLRLVLSGVISVILTTAGMLSLGARHSPACATTLIVSLGLLTTLWDALFIMLAVSVMYAVHWGLSLPRKGSTDT